MFAQFRLCNNLGGQTMGWPMFWAILLQTHLATLFDGLVELTLVKLWVGTGTSDIDISGENLGRFFLTRSWISQMNINLLQNLLNKTK
jgi:hypothetical protein